MNERQWNVNDSRKISIQHRTRNSFTLFFTLQPSRVYDGTYLRRTYREKYPTLSQESQQVQLSMHHVLSMCCLENIAQRVEE